MERAFPPSAAGDRLFEHNRIELPDAAVAAGQLDAFVDLLRQNGVTVHRVEDLPHVALQTYPRDLAVVIDDVLVRTRSREPIRNAERAGLDHVFERVSTVADLPSGTVEGGDVIVTGTDVLVGLGEETDPDGVAQLRKVLAAHDIGRAVVPIAFAHGGVMHLDTKFTMASPAVGLVVPSAFTPESLRLLAERFELIEVTDEEAADVQVNTVALAPDRLVVSATAGRVADELAKRDIVPVPLDFAEVTRLPGSFRCATMPLIRG
nr:arginine deiminase family protein [Kibdelosporangium phytohabitans]